VTEMDNDKELEKIRKRKMQELLRQQTSEEGEVEERERYEEEKRNLMKQLLTPEARERLARIRLAKPEFADQIEDQLIALAQSGRLTKMIDDATFKKILEQFQSRKRDIKIKRE
jgi:DNA-binding protein